VGYSQRQGYIDFFKSCTAFFAGREAGLTMPYFISGPRWWNFGVGISVWLVPQVALGKRLAEAAQGQ
jgi:hypothetical protein